MDAESVKIIIDAIANLLNILGFTKLLILIAVFTIVYFIIDIRKSKKENAAIEIIERLQSRNIEQLSDRVRKLEDKILIEEYKIKSDILDKLNAVQKEIKTNAEQQQEEIKNG